MSIMYSEDIGFQGVLKVEEESFYIEYYFSGPDSRYSGVTLIIKGNEIEDYIKAWELNFEEYLKLKHEYQGKHIEKKARKDMNIKIGEFYEGVCLRGNHLPINTKRKLGKVIESLVYAKGKASKQINA